jgi:flagellar hook-associated protein 3 FlgL
MINATGNRMTAEIRRQSTLARAISETQIQVSSGKRIQRASDDPSASARLSTLRQSRANDDAWSANISLAASLAAQADTSLKGASDLMVRAKELLIAGASDSTSASDRASMALELRDIAAELDEYQATTAATGQKLFSGTSALSMRIDKDVTMTPVPGRAELFDIAGVNISDMVRDAASALEAGNDIQIATSLATIDNGISHIADAAAKIGLKAAKIERVNESHLARAIDREAERSSLEDTDLSHAIAQLNAQTITLEAAQAAFARINRRTLFDILS